MTTTTGEQNGQILKQDHLGRVLTPRERREMLLDEFVASGMSGAAFAARVGVKYPTFATWVQKRRRRRTKLGDARKHESSRPAGSCRWVEVVAGNPTTQLATPLVVLLPGGARVELRDAAGVALAVELIGRLAGGTGC